MRLRRIEAVRFGRIDGRSLGDLSDGLTIVHGPNEAGKSSFTALVRHVLYGFPTPADVKEAPYLSSAGDREGRLVFDDGERQWIVQRGKGPHGGAVTVLGTDGSRRDGLVNELTAGVTRHAYRVVLGFGLSDLSQLEELKGKDDDLIAHLYAAGAGIGGSLMSARKALAGEMEELWKKGGQTPRLNKARSERERMRAEARRLESETESLRQIAERLTAATAELEAARARRVELQAAADRIGKAVAEASKLRESADEAAREAERLSRDAEAAAAEAAAMPTDPDGLAAADAVDALAEELSGFRGQLEVLAAQQARLDAIDARARAALKDTGWTEEQARGAAADVGIGPELDAFRERIAKARARVDYAASALEAARAADAETATEVPVAAASWMVPGVVIAAIGLAGVAAGFVLSQTPLLLFAAVLLAAGLVLAFIRHRPARPVQPAGRRAVAAEAEVRSAEQSLAELTEGWGVWAVQRGLGNASDDPAAVAARYTAARAISELDTERSQAAGSAQRAQAAIEAYAVRVAGVCGTLLGENPDAVEVERVGEYVNRARSRVAAARTAHEAASESAVAAASIARSVEEAALRAAELAERAAQSLAAACVDDDLDSARAAEMAARAAAAEASDDYDRLAEEVTELRTKLGSERRDATLADVRLSEQALAEGIAQGARDYAALALASRLLGLTQERFERDRQPAVVKNAEAAFLRMTHPRYSRIAVPLGKDAIEVFDATGNAMPPAKLSRGTAEQLYLALRIGLIDQLGDAGASLPVLMDDVLVNFSPERAEEAAGAIADLAQRRQVVFFTCHPSTAELLGHAAPQAARLDIAPSA